MSASRVFKKGEFLLKEGEKTSPVFLIQSGSVALFLSRNKLNIDLATLGASQVVGEHVLWGAGTHPHSAIANSETKVLELTSDEAKIQFEASSPLIKQLSKGLIDKLKLISKEHQSMKLERDNTPCSPEHVTKVFGALYHSVITRGEKLPEGGTRVDWSYLKQYAQRIFLESPKRMEMVTNIFVKLGMASYQKTHVDDVEEIESVTFREPDGILQFVDYYQYHYFKGKSEILRTDERAIGIVQLLLKMAETETASRQGIVKLDYSHVVEKVKEILNLQLNADHFTLLETKGIFVKRQSGDKGVALSFEITEFKKALIVWKLLREVERWNMRGVVELIEPTDVKKAQNAHGECPACHSSLVAQPKFCPECGFKLLAAA
jgi:hypothetical protein